MWFRGEHVTVDPPRLLVFTETITDETGAAHSDVTTVRVELEGDGHGSTRVRLTHLGIPADSPGATGWEMALDKLTALIDTH
jgi:uncharacterized protein YndB with AHSA1/START domain